MHSLPRRAVRAVVLGLAVALLVPAAAAPALAVDPTACKVDLFNNTTNVLIRSYTTFTEAVAGAASSGSRLEVYGKCTAGIETGKSLVITGKRTATSGRPVLKAPPSSRVLSIKAGAAVAINTITIRGGQVTGSAPANQGGGIRNAGFLTLTSVIVRNNQAVDGGGIWTTNGAANTKLRLQGDTRIMRNTASNNGGGVAVVRGTLEVVGRTEIEHDTAVNGGGIDGASATITLGGFARVHDNVGSYGGGLSVYTASGGAVSSVTINGTSEIDHNTADAYGAAINIEGAITTAADTSIHDNLNTSDKGGIIDIYSYGVPTSGTFNGDVTDNTSGPNGAALVSWQDCGATPTLAGLIAKVVVDNSPRNVWLRTGTSDC